MVRLTEAHPLKPLRSASFGMMKLTINYAGNEKEGG